MVDAWFDAIAAVLKRERRIRRVLARPWYL